MTVLSAPQVGEHVTPQLDAASPRRSWGAAPTVGGLAALTVLAIALRVEGIGTWYWVDEALSVGIARHDLVDIPRLLLRDGSPPLWYLLVHAWTAVVGTTPAATHAMSAVFGVAVVPLAWLAADRLFGRRAAWFAGLLAALSPFISYFSRETRMYTLVAVLTCVVAWSFVAAFVDLQRRMLGVFAASGVLLVYAHNWGLYTLISCALALVPIALASHDRRDLARRAGIAFSIIAVAYLPWVPALLSQVQNTGAPWSFTPSARGVVRELAALFRDERVLVAIGPVALAGLASIARRWRTRDGLATISLGLLCVVPVGIGWAVSHLEPSWATRYLAVVVPLLILLLALGLSRAGGIGVVAVALAAVLILQPVTRINGLLMPRDAKSNAHGIAEAMAARLDEGDLVVIAQPEAVPLFRYELGPALVYADPTGRIDDPTYMDWRDADERLRAASYAERVKPMVDSLQRGGRVLVVVPGREPRRTDTSWIRLFRSRGRQVVAGLRADPRFQLIGRALGSDEEYVTFDAVLFERR